MANVRRPLAAGAEVAIVHPDVVPLPYRAERRRKSMAQTLPVVSVFIPVYNDEKTIGAAVQSVLDQTWTDLEVVVVDDGSTDATADVLARYEDPRLRVHSQKNRGVVKAGNAAARLTRGEFLARLDGDDVAHPERIARQLAFMQENPDCSVCGSGWIVRTLDGAETEATIPPGSDAELRWQLLWCIAFPNSTLMMRRSQFDEVGGYDEKFYVDFPHNSDFDLVERLSAKGTVGIIEAPLITWLYDAEGGISALNRGSQRVSSLEISRRQLARLLPGVTPADARAAWRIMNDPKRLEPGEPKAGALTLLRGAEAFRLQRAGSGVDGFVLASLSQHGKNLGEFNLAKGPKREIRRAGQHIQAYAASGKIPTALLKKASRVESLGRRLVGLFR